MKEVFTRSRSIYVRIFTAFMLSFSVGIAPVLIGQSAPTVPDYESCENMEDGEETLELIYLFEDEHNIHNDGSRHDFINHEITLHTTPAIEVKLPPPKLV